MSENEGKDQEESDLDARMKQEVLKAASQEVGDKGRRGNINYTHSPVQVSEAVGAIFLGLLAVLLLVALLLAHRQERRAREGR
ncbi:MAG: hypothetical protein HYW07_04425 [Candidatus Latescibacteria bacterium]|nr:hypothetical protein [Candidatus Latescibacterota bacterium]